MATFSVDFLGCKVSHADAQALREACSPTVTRSGTAPQTSP